MGTSTHRGRRRRTNWIGALSAGLMLAGCGSATDSEPDPAEVENYHSRPDLTPPTTTVDQLAEHQPMDGSNVFVATKGEDVPFTGGLILDDVGEPVWIEPTEQAIFDLRVQEYGGEPVLTYWRGESKLGHGYGEVVILDSTYSEIATVTTGDDVGPDNADIHETTLTPEGTALLISYVPTEADLSDLDGPEDGWAFDSVLQEVDVASGEVVFEWHSRDHVDVTESLATPDPDLGGDGTEEKPFSYFHLNSVTVDHDGDLLLSSRNTSALYKIDRETGEIIWTLGGESSDFEMGPDTPFYWQHDAARQPDGTITLFDNQSAPDIGDTARGLRLEVDEQAMTVELVQEYLPPDGDRTSGSQGSFQVLPDGSSIVGWGSKAYYSEYAADGTPVSNVALGPGHSYRAYRAVWTGTPSEPPAAVVEGDSVFVSWNGATEVAGWRLVVDGAPQDVVPRDGFETELPLHGAEGDIVVDALDANGVVLGSVTAD